MITSATHAIIKDVVDRGAVLDRFEGDLDLVREVVELFLEDCPRRLSAIGEAIVSDDSRALQFAAHSLKGSVSNFAATSAVTAALRLEMIGRSGDLRDAAAAYAVLQEEIVRLMPALAALVR
jgi:two-component system sensor histidine kinase/response regulator